VNRSSSVSQLSNFVVAVALAIASIASAAADQTEGRRDESDRHPRAPVYQRRAFDRMHGHPNRHGNKRRHAAHRFSPPVNAGWFQRPYPYHLDYYRMRYGGSYAPYFGNLYGPPQVVTAPPYYGPYYGEYVQPGIPYNGGYGAPFAIPDQRGGFEGGGTTHGPEPSNEPDGSINSDNLPAPTQ
jgi:hypothetical protein